MLLVCGLPPLGDPGVEQVEEGHVDRQQADHAEHHPHHHLHIRLLVGWLLAKGATLLTKPMLCSQTQRQRKYVQNVTFITKIFLCSYLKGENIAIIAPFFSLYNFHSHS